MPRKDNAFAVELTKRIVVNVEAKNQKEAKEKALNDDDLQQSWDRSEATAKIIYKENKNERTG